MFTTTIFKLKIFIMLLSIVLMISACKDNATSPKIPDNGGNTGGSGGGSQPPVAAFTANLTSIYAGGAVYFEDRSTGDPKAWEWKFGDGSVSQEQNPIHVYSSPGTYTVSLRVSNASGSTIKTNQNYINVEQRYVQIRHSSAVSGSITVTVGGISYEIQKNGSRLIPVSRGSNLSIWECIWVNNAWSCRWDGQYHVLPNRRYKVIDASSVRWDLTLATD